jgi:hypothetical protein
MPRTKTPKRYKHLQPKLSPESGTWAAGIRNSEMLSLFGDIVSAWVHVEESMIEVMEMLVFLVMTFVDLLSKEPMDSYRGDKFSAQ